MFVSFVPATNTHCTCSLGSIASSWASASVALTGSLGVDMDLESRRAASLVTDLRLGKLFYVVVCEVGNFSLRSRIGSLDLHFCLIYVENVYIKHCLEKHVDPSVVCEYLSLTRISCFLRLMRTRTRPARCTVAA